MPLKDGGLIPNQGPTLLGVPMKWVSLVLLVFQTVGVVFTMRLSRTMHVEGPRYLNTTAVFFSEIMKLCCSCVFLRTEVGTVSRAAALVHTSMIKRPKDLLRVCVPSLLYIVQNNLLFVSLSNLSAASYQVTYQLKILSTAVLSVLILKRSLEPTKWVALVALTAGVSLIQLPRGDAAAAAAAVPSEGNMALGLVAVLSACVTSGLAGVSLEQVFKQSDSSIWLRNIQLACVGVVIGFLLVLVNDGAKIRSDGFMQGYNGLVWAVILLQAIGGLVVAAVLKYADNILKCFGNAISIIITCTLSAVLLHEFVPDLLFLLGTVLVLGASALYSLGLPQDFLHRAKSLARRGTTDKVSLGD
eukprot:NODE_8441_length_1495_cov_7.983187.p1 GENE.NODE_8441_length_1495_cov_7.983187~~NODE_8441_length_1495_cov_7.983187.p1  ORF type:complete len:358 (-),score=63.52 NODE_8441_length_1495_cov_7.983187:239-1312(-)